MENLGVTRNHIISELSKSLHGQLGGYVPVISQACEVDPEFVARLIAYDYINGQIKDTKIALPVVTLAVNSFPEELTENSLAHLALQSPRELVKAFRFAVQCRLPKRRQNAIERTIRRYLYAKEQNPSAWSRTVLRHRRAMHSLYALSHSGIPEWGKAILFHGDYIPGSAFADVKVLRNAPPELAAGIISKWHLSPLIVTGAMAGAPKTLQESSAVVQASMDQMSDQEVVVRAKSLEKKGATKDPSMKERLRGKLAKASKAVKGVATLKAGVAAEEVEDESLKTMLRELQERQIAAQKGAGRGLEGNWIGIIDMSASQESSIELGKHIGAALAKFVNGKVFLVFCNTSVTAYDVTGMALEEIQARTKYIRASGGTSYGVGLEWAVAHRREVGEIDGVFIVGDGGENNNPIFANSYKALSASTGKDVPVYFWQTAVSMRHSGWGSNNNPRQFETFMNSAGMTLAGKFDLTHGNTDYYAVPNMVQSMSANKFGVVDKIMASPLITLEQVLGVASTVLPRKEKANA